MKRIDIRWKRRLITAAVWILCALIPGGGGALAGEITGADPQAQAGANTQAGANAQAAQTELPAAATPGVQAPVENPLKVNKASSLKQARRKKLDGMTKIKKTYYYLKKGKPVKSRAGKVVRKGAYAWFVEKDGTLKKGWHLLGGKLYYTKAKGLIQKSCKKDGVKIGKKGYAAANTANLRKVSKYSLELTSAQILAGIAGLSASREAKLRAAWNFLSSKSNFRYIRTYESFSPSSARGRAMNMLRGRGGNCYDFACAFAALAQAAGYEAYVVYGMCPAAGGGMTTHGWTYLSGAGYFDVEGNFAGWGPGVYGYGGNPYVEHGRVHI